MIDIPILTSETKKAAHAHRLLRFISCIDNSLNSRSCRRVISRSCCWANIYSAPPLSINTAVLHVFSNAKLDLRVASYSTNVFITLSACASF